MTNEYNNFKGLNSLAIWAVEASCNPLDIAKQKGAVASKKTK